MTTISATPVLSSKHAVTGDVLHTLLLRYPRFIHAEFMTHRVFSRNAASSRAIPVAKLIEDVELNPAVPIVWTKNAPGMQGYEELTGDALLQARLSWNAAKNDAIANARTLATTGAHKQIVNRLIEPFAHITVLVSGTSWDGFLALRDHPAAEPHMQMLAKAVRACIEGVTPQILEPGYWHLPFLTEQERERVCFVTKQMLSVARCASTSYKTVEGFDMTIERAEVIYEKLRNANPIHASPFEHVAQADYVRHAGGAYGAYAHPEEHRNFSGFRQLRAFVEVENV